MKNKFAIVVAIVFVVVVASIVLGPRARSSAVRWLNVKVIDDLVYERVSATAIGFDRASLDLPTGTETLTDDDGKPYFHFRIANPIAEHEYAEVFLQPALDVPVVSGMLVYEGVKYTVTEEAFADKAFDLLKIYVPNNSFADAKADLARAGIVREVDLYDIRKIYSLKGANPYFSVKVETGGWMTPGRIVERILGSVHVD